jgi:tetratricopeptide (TPR) repeat protein
MIFSWLKNQRRKRLLAEPIPWAWLEYLTRNVRHYERLDGQRRAIPCQVVQVLVAEKHWVGGAGFDVTEEMKVTVAGQAAVLVLGLEEPYYFFERRYALAARAVTRVIEPAPEDGEAYQYRATARVKLGRYAEALADSNEALRRDPNDVDAFRARGAA